MSPSFLAKTGFSVGEGVISGVSVCTSFVGIGGAGLIAYTVSVSDQRAMIGKGSKHP